MKKKLLFLLLISGLFLVIGACSSSGDSGGNKGNQGKSDIIYQSEAMTVDSGGRLVRSNEFMNQVYLGQMSAASKSEGGEFSAYQGCAAVLVWRMKSEIRTDE